MDWNHDEMTKTNKFKIVERVKEKRFNFVLNMQ